MKKTIGLNPLEEYLSAPKNQLKSTEKKAKEAAEKQIIEPAQLAEEPVKQFVSHETEIHDLSEAVEIDPQGQFAIKGTQVTEELASRPSKQRITLHISSELVDRVKNAVYWEPGLTVAGFSEEAFTKMIELLEAERGAPFPQRKQHKLRGGRPVS